MCEWGKAPKDAPEKRYRKLAWWMVSSRLYPYVRGLARRCSGQHAHAPLQGKNPDGINRTTEAAAYPWELCKGFAKAIKAAYEGRPATPCSQPHPPTLEAAQAARPGTRAGLAEAEAETPEALDESKAQEQVVDSKAGA